MGNQYPEIPPDQRPSWSHYLKVYTYFIGRTIYGDDPEWCKTWKVDENEIIFGFEDDWDYSYHDVYLLTENLGDGRLKITLLEHTTWPGATSDLYWKEQLVESDLQSKVGLSWIVTGIPARAITVEIHDEVGVYDRLEEPPTIAGYWILGVWCRLVRGRHDIIKAEDHNNVKEVLTRALNLLKDKGYK
jgi:hypothetical protein